MQDQSKGASTSSGNDYESLQKALMLVEETTGLIAGVVANWQTVRRLTKLKDFPRLEIPGHPADETNDIVHLSSTLHDSLQELNEVRKNLLSIGIKHSDDEDI